jgi:hypothetical protein
MRIVLSVMLLTISDSILASSRYCGQGDGCKWSAGIFLTAFVTVFLVSVGKSISKHGFINGLFVESSFPIVAIYMVGFPACIYIFYWVSQFGMRYFVGLWFIFVAIYWAYKKYRS